MGKSEISIYPSGLIEKLGGIVAGYSESLLWPRFFKCDLTPIDDSFEETSMVDKEKDREVSVVKVLFAMETPVENEMFEYIAGDSHESLYS